MLSYLIFGVVVFLICMIVLVISLTKTKKQDVDEENTKHTGEKKLKQVTDIINIVSYDTENRCYRMKDDKYMDLLQVQSKDLANSSSDDVEYDILKFCKTYRLYEGDLKIVSMNFPCNTKVQQEFLKRKKEQTSNSVFKRCLDEQIRELIYLEKHVTTREYYYMIFADSLDEMEENKRSLKAVLLTGRDGLLEEISDEKKHQILYRLNNKCSQVA